MEQPHILCQHAEVRSTSLFVPFHLLEVERVIPFFRMNRSLRLLLFPSPQGWKHQPRRMDGRARHFHNRDLLLVRRPCRFLPLQPSPWWRERQWGARLHLHHPLQWEKGQHGVTLLLFLLLFWMEELVPNLWHRRFQPSFLVLRPLVRARRRRVLC